MISAHDISKIFNSGRPNEFTALHGVSLDVRMHETTVLKGPSGSGKTTLLGLMGCMARPTAGRIFLDGREITSLPERFLTQIRRSTFGFIFQQFNLVKGLSALENVMVPAYPNGEKFPLLRKRALETLEMFGLDKRADARIEWLSGGEAQRVAIARALINNPAIIIADEPTAHLDTKLSHEFMGIMSDLKAKGTTIILSSHDPIVYDSDLADRVVELRDGQVISERKCLMILNPGILSLLISSILISLMTLYAAGYGVLILRRWDITSGSELQLALERRTYLISTIVSYFLAFQLVSLFLFIQTADSICHLFIGAMCAVGTLTVNNFGYPTLLLKIITFVMAGLWLILNHADNQGYDYPLIKAKYRLLLIMTPLIVAETVVQGIYFLGLKPDIITSCCGSLFSKGSSGIATEIMTIPSAPMEICFYASMAALIAASLWFFMSGRGGYLFACVSGITSVVSLISLISFISLYFYEMPSHHCPFCILQKEYNYVGYPLYILLLSGTVAGLGVGLLQPFRKKESLEKIIPAIQRNLVAISVISFLVFTAISSYQIVFSSFKLEGY